MQVAVPHGCAPGQQFRAIVDGREVLLTCPANAPPGSILLLPRKQPAPAPTGLPFAPPPGMPLSLGPPPPPQAMGVGAPPHWGGQGGQGGQGGHWGGHQGVSAAASPPALKPANFRTQMCRRWQEGRLADGQPCEFGLACNFAHGPSQLQGGGGGAGGGGGGGKECFAFQVRRQKGKMAMGEACSLSCTPCCR